MNLATTQEEQHILEKSQKSGGFLCFSYNKSSENSKDTSGATFEMASDGMLIRIPGPQILGYIQQVVPKDNSKPYDAKQSLGKEFYLPPVLSPDLSKNEKDRTSNANGIGSGAAHGLRGQEEPRDPKYAGYNFGVAHTSMSSTRDPNADLDTLRGAKAHVIGSTRGSLSARNWCPAAATALTNLSDSQSKGTGESETGPKSHMVNGPTTTPLADAKGKSVEELASKVQQNLILGNSSFWAASVKST